MNEIPHEKLNEPSRWQWDKTGIVWPSRLRITLHITITAIIGVGPIDMCMCLDNGHCEKIGRERETHRSRIFT